MNRKEFATKIQDLINRAYLADIPKSYYKGLFDEAEKLRYPITLAEFLGWEENVEYEVEDKTYIMKYLDLPKHYKLKGKLYNDSLELSWKGGNLETRELHLIIDELKQAKKVEPKPKAWRVRDEYSLECLVQELQDQGFKYKSLTLEEHMEIKKEMLSRNGVTYIYVDEDNGINGFDKHYSLIDEYDLIEYRKEEPKVYAKIKGWELYSDNDYYWKYYIEDELFVDYKFENELYKTKFTKTEWNELGINDSNADWEKVAE